MDGTVVKSSDIKQLRVYSGDKTNESAKYFFEKIGVLRDKRIVLAGNGKVLIYNISDLTTEKDPIDITEEMYYGINDVAQTENGKIIFSEGHENLMLYSINENEMKKEFVWAIPHCPERNENPEKWTVTQVERVVAISGNRIATSSYNSDEIRIWGCEPPYSNDPLKIIKVGKIYNMIFFDKQNYIAAGDHSNTYFINADTYEIVKTLEYPTFLDKYLFLKLGDDRLALINGGVLKILNVNTFTIEKQKEMPFSFCSCGIALDDKNIIYGDVDAHLFLYNYDTNEFQETKGANQLYRMVRIDDERFATLQYRVNLIIWSYKNNKK